MTQPETSQTSTRSPLWLRGLLFVSLCLNLLVAGSVIGHLFADGPERKVPRVDRMGGPMTFALTPEDRHEIGKSLRAEYRAGRPSRREVLADYQSVITALRADPFDPAAVQASFDSQLEASTERIAIGQQILMDRLTAMSPEDRHRFADRLEEGLAHRQKGERQKDDHRKGDRGMPEPEGMR